MNIIRLIKCNSEVQVHMYKITKIMSFFKRCVQNRAPPKKITTPPAGIEAWKNASFFKSPKDSTMLSLPPIHDAICLVLFDSATKPRISSLLKAEPQKCCKCMHAFTACVRNGPGLFPCLRSERKNEALWFIWERKLRFFSKRHTRVTWNLRASSSKWDCF